MGLIVAHLIFTRNSDIVGIELIVETNKELSQPVLTFNFSLFLRTFRSSLSPIPHSLLLRSSSSLYKYVKSAKKREREREDSEAPFLSVSALYIRSLPFSLFSSSSVVS